LRSQPLTRRCSFACAAPAGVVIIGHVGNVTETKRTGPRTQPAKNVDAVSRNARRALTGSGSSRSWWSK
jgi:hypothetical protein